MKHILIGLSLVLAAQFSMADDDLKNHMKVMGGQFKILARGLQSKKLNEAEFKAVKQLQRSSAAAALIYPDTAGTNDDKLTYATWMAELVEASLRLEDAMDTAVAVTPVDTTEAMAIFVEINEIRKKGHGQFKVD